MTEPTTPQPEAKLEAKPEAKLEAKPEAKPEAGEAKRYAAYDLTYLRFVPGVHATKAAATKAAKAAEVADFEIREV